MSKLDNFIVSNHSQKIKKILRPFWRLVPKGYSEMLFWRSCFKVDKGVFANFWYEGKLLDIAGESNTDFISGKVVADFGCGPRGSLVWAKKALLRIGIDVLADKYSDEFTQSIISHGMIYLKSTEKVIPLPSDFVDVMFTMNAMDHVNSLSVMCNEVIRVIKPGGEFIGSFNLLEPPTSTEPQRLTEQIIHQYLLSTLEIISYKMSPKVEGCLWVRAKKPIMS